MRSIVRINVMTCHATKVVFVVFVIVVHCPPRLDIHEFFKMFLSLFVKYFTRVSIKLTPCIY